MVSDVVITRADGTKEIRPVTASGALAKLPTEKQVRYLRDLYAALGEPDRRMPRTRQGAMWAITDAKRRLAGEPRPRARRRRA